MDSFGPYTPLDLAIGWLAGTEPRPPLPRPLHGERLRDVFERVLDEHFARGPVAVLLSGGRDSASLLAVAIDVARRRGHPDPLVVSVVFDDARTARDEAAQRTIVSALSLEDSWERVTPEQGVEILGPDSLFALRRHGLLFPANAAWMLPALRRLQGLGSQAPVTVLASHGSGEVFGYWPYGRVHQMIRGRLAPSTRDVRTLTYGLLPLPVRAWLQRRRQPIAQVPWLRSGVAGELEALREPPAALRWDRALGYLATRRCEKATADTYAALGRDFGLDVQFPKLDPRYLGALVHLGGAAGFGDRDRLMRELAGDQLPVEILKRHDRIGYGRLFFGDACRAFGQRWSGTGLPEDLVDPDVLRDLWSSDQYDWRSAPLLQAAWLHDDQAGG